MRGESSFRGLMTSIMLLVLLSQAERPDSNDRPAPLLLNNWRVTLADELPHGQRTPRPKAVASLVLGVSHVH
ncbi:hypothetical protein DAT35_12430 [Vitiosangium sp. GDMCC 1.1324]|nr:hypothetical protein DAT35_12430 [Vitiosangium sp. GDMCC 1.1324]